MSAVMSVERNPKQWALSYTIIMILIDLEVKVFAFVYDMMDAYNSIINLSPSLIIYYLSLQM
jgi:hypothetical protein